MDLERCRDCRYPLTGLLNDARCPECGGTEREESADLRLHRRSGPAVAGVIAVTVLSCLVHPIVALAVPTMIVLVTAIMRRDGRRVLFGLGFVVALTAIPIAQWCDGVSERNLVAAAVLGSSIVAAIASLIDTPPVRPRRIVPILAIVTMLLTIPPVLRPGLTIWRAHREASAIIEWVNSHLTDHRMRPSTLETYEWRDRRIAPHLSYDADATVGYVIHIWATDENVAWRYDPIDGWAFIADRLLWWD